MKSSVIQILLQKINVLTEPHLYGNFELFVQRLQTKSPLTIQTYLQDHLSALTYFYKQANATEYMNPQTRKLTSFPIDIMIWRDYLEERYKTVTARTQVKNLASLKAYARIFDTELLAVLEKIHKPKIGLNKPKALTLDEMNKLLTNISSERVSDDRLEYVDSRTVSSTEISAVRGKTYKDDWYTVQELALWMYLYGCGLRISEGLQLNTDKVRGIIRDVEVIGKGNRVRKVPVLQEVSDILRRFLNVRPVTDHPFLFIDKKLQPLNRFQAAKMLSKTRVRLGLPEYLTPHSLRHSFVTHLLENGVCLRTIQELVGHATLSTIQNYAQVSVKHLESVYSNAAKKGKIE